MFRLVKILGGRINQAEPVFLSATAGEAYQIGEALTLVGGALTKCPATVAPAFICGMDCAAATEEGRLLVVYPVAHDMIFECPVTASPVSLAEGDQVTLSEDAMGVTATTAGGVATLWNLAGADEADDKIYVKF